MEQKIKSVKHIKQLATRVAGLLSDTNDKYSDVQLKVGDKTFHCHKVILAIKSPYFDELLFPSSSSSSAAAATTVNQQQQIVLKDVSAKSFESALNFMYTGEIKLSSENVDSVFEVASWLQLNDLAENCQKFLLNSMDPISSDNCIRYWKLAVQMDLASMADSCKRVCKKQFVKISSSSQLSSLSEKMMKELLEDDELAVESEEYVCETLTQWLNSQTQAGYTVKPYHLLTRIRWSGVPVGYVSSTLLKLKIFSSDRQCSAFLSKVDSFRRTGVPFEGLRTFHRPSTGIETCVVTVGLNSGSSISPDVYRLSLQKENVIAKERASPFGMQNGIAACVLGSQLYITGGGANNMQTWAWESEFGWVRCGNTNQGRLRHCATSYNNTSMYVLGGYDRARSETLESIEQYNTATDKWTKVGLLVHAARSAACVVHKKYIYVFGGAEQSNKPLDCVQVFNTVTNNSFIYL